ncbi:hypothetical protein PQ459_16230 [Chryseobacterium sp. KACC 21268]|nr:hypothetical protein PQ459_16230 [Chryseobacterium sp. KACC 21268]
MKTKLLLLLLLWAGVAWGQGLFNVSFVKDSLIVNKSKTNEIIVPIEITKQFGKQEIWNNYTLGIKIEKSSLPDIDYDIDFSSKEFSKMRDKETIYVKIKKDSLVDRDRRLVFQLVTKESDKDVNDQNLGSKKKFVLIVKSSKPDDISEDYKILSYVGTNFDMAEGKTKAKNLFFATNIFVPPTNYKRYGFYLSLYGNRTMSRTDSTEYSQRTSKVQPITDSTYIRLRTSGSVITTATSDNIGAFFSPLIRISKKVDNNLNLYYAPSLEFVWRRINLERVYGTPTKIDTLHSLGYIPSTIILNQNTRSEFNEFDFSAGIIGALMVYETKDFSVRVQSSVGYLGRFYNNSVKRVDMNVFGSESYPPMDRKHYIFYMGRAWITEAVTGITLQAEISNQLKNSRPAFGVTLSKAFKIKDIAKILTPLLTR